ncbi:hypothetical protein N7465_011576 [Penicillium sp. CMV-2018d]|nr:hypothetical protein N7465_011576 [Penicillium sp. CMV-2018d]
MISLMVTNGYIDKRNAEEGSPDGTDRALPGQEETTPQNPTSLPASGSQEKERAQRHLKFLDKWRATTLEAIHQNECMLERLRMRLRCIDEDITAQEQKVAQ